MTTSVTAEQDFDFVSGVIQEAVYFEFGDEHHERGDLIDLTAGLRDDPILKGGMAVLLFPAVGPVLDGDLDDEEGLSSVAGMVREPSAGGTRRPRGSG